MIKPDKVLIGVLILALGIIIGMRHSDKFYQRQIDSIIETNHKQCANGDQYSCVKALVLIEMKLSGEL